MKCNDRASLVKTWLPSQYTGAPHYLDQMIYDHALSLVCYLFCFCCLMFIVV
jgi:serine/threonine-protein kinase ULK/ATG1